MVGSRIGRAMLALPFVLAAVSLAAVVTGVTGELALGGVVFAASTLVCLARVSRTGVLVDLEREQIVLRTCLRTRRLSLDELQRVDARVTPDSPLPTVRVITGDGRAYGTRALAYLPDDEVDRLVEQLRAATRRRPFEVAIDRSSFRRVES